MIKELTLDKLDEVMEIWISTNIKAHNFISEQYWINNFDLVKEMIANSDVYIFEENNIIKGFIGIVDQNYIAGLFVRDIYQRDGVGKELLNYCKSKYSSLMLDVFIKNKNALSFYQKNNFKVIQKHFNEGLQEQEYTMYFGKR
ncbi:N-acetyltransferase [uncultured Clostridium sp.]|uniref:N-acetyltransferase n=1 Tax=uncultured Clostridium sp. TaxID=59620 RepID=UPI0025EBFD68|nr:N-acetyltransferase [uncultured Clostridium sp.]